MAVLSILLSQVLPGVSALIIAILLGIAVANLTALPPSLSPACRSRRRSSCGPGSCCWACRWRSETCSPSAPRCSPWWWRWWPHGILGTLALGRALGVEKDLTLLVACGFSICGAAAVAAAAGVTDPEDEHEERTITAIALVVLCGTLMIAAVPAVAATLELAPETAGLWAGASIHEVAQVVAAGGALGGAALTVAVIVKLARVLMLAPVMAVLSLQQRREGAAEGTRPPLVPLFVLGFLAMVLLRSVAPLPAAVLDLGGLAQTGLLAAAMFALGTGVKVRNLLQVGARPLALAALSTLLVATLALGGVLLAA